MKVENCPVVEALLTGKIKVKGKDYPVKLSQSTNNFPGQEGCIFNWIEDHAGHFTAATLHCRVCNLQVTVGKHCEIDRVG